MLFRSIATLSPDGGPSYGTTTVTITGTNLNTDPRGTIVHFGTRQATGVQCASATRCTAISPIGLGTVDMVVEVAVASQADFMVTHNLRDFGPAKRFGLRVLAPGTFLNHLLRS